MEEKKGEVSNTFWYTLMGICFVLIVLIAVGFFFFGNRKEKVIEKEENGGNVVLNYTNNVSGLSITKAVPTTDAVGMKNEAEGQYFDFSVDVSLDNAAAIEYEISVAKNTRNSTITDQDIRIYLEQEKSGTYTKVFGPKAFQGVKEETELGSKKGSMVLAKIKKTKKSTDNYRLRMWLSDKSVVSEGNYSVDVLVNGKAQ